MIRKYNARLAQQQWQQNETTPPSPVRSQTNYNKLEFEATTQEAVRVYIIHRQVRHGMRE